MRKQFAAAVAAYREQRQRRIGGDAVGPGQAHLRIHCRAARVQQAIDIGIGFASNRSASETSTSASALRIARARSERSGAGRDGSRAAIPVSRRWGPVTHAK